MNRVVLIVVYGMLLAGCSGLNMPAMKDLYDGSVDTRKRGPDTPNWQFYESDPAGAEVKTSLGQSCRTPCTLAAPASDFTVTFSNPGFEPQVVPVRVIPGATLDPTTGELAAMRLVPNPVRAVLQPDPFTRQRLAAVSEPPPIMPEAAPPPPPPPAPPPRERVVRAPPPRPAPARSAAPKPAAPKPAGPAVVPSALSPEPSASSTLWWPAPR